MMEAVQRRISTSKIKTAFKTMDFDESNIESIEDAKNWLRENENLYSNKSIGEAHERIELVNVCKKDVEVLAIVSSDLISSGKSEPMTNFERTCNILKVADELEEKSDLICQLEMCLRGISSRDTKKSVKFLADTLRYYAGTTFSEEPCDENLEYRDYREDAFFNLDRLGQMLGPHLSQNIQTTLLANPTSIPLLCFINQILDTHGFQNLELETIHGMTPGNSPMVIFSDADLYSASESAINQAWGHHGLLPWSLSTILIQEEIFEKFVQKMKYRLTNLKMGFANDKSADINYPVLVKNFEKHLEILIKESKSIGIEVFKADQNFGPTLFIGGLLPENIFNSEELKIPKLALVAFRHKTEAIALANKLSSGFAATIWSNNVELSNYTAEKLNVENVWINSHVHFEPDIPFLLEKQDSYFLSVNNKSLIDFAKNVQQNWNSLNYKTRCQTLRNVAIKLESIQHEFKDIWIKMLIKSSSKNSQKSYIRENYEVKYLGNICGIVAYPLEVAPKVSEADIDKIIRAMMDGSFVYIFVEGTEKYKYILQELETHLPIKVTTKQELVSNGYYSMESILKCNHKAVWFHKKC